MLQATEHLTMNDHAYNTCVQSHADRIYRFVLKNLRHEQDARDIVQSAFEKLWIGRKEVNETTARNYLFTIAYHLMIDHIRKSKRVEYRESFEENESLLPEPRTGLREALDAAFFQLNETQRSLVLLKDYEGYTYAEIGAITGLNESQVKVYLHRARKQLKNYLVKIENCI